MGAIVYPVCRHCGRVPRMGLRDGFRLRGAFFCTECRNKILTIEIGSPEYADLFGEVRRIMFPQHQWSPGRAGADPGKDVLADKGFDG